ncbi:MAG: PLP-dependent transferase, partial [Neisseriaceae bacterium]|nr:PLP-dependent transferase [Neisseriaceae bacterium]
GGVVSIYLKNDTRQAANQVIQSLKLIQMSSSLGGVESLVNHSYTQSHSGMSPDVKEKLGIKEGLLRFSIGIEYVEDIWADLNNALNSVV